MPATRSDAPTPRLSISSSRLNDAMRRRKRANGGNSHVQSTWETQPGTSTTSMGPSPTA